MRFTKHRNPSRKRKRTKLDYNERCILAGKAMLIDREMGYDLPVSAYEPPAPEWTNMMDLELKTEKTDEPGA